MIYRCIKIQHKPINVQERVQIQRSKETECALVWRTGLSGAPGPYNVQLVTLGFLEARSAIIHRNVRCTNGCFVVEGYKYPPTTTTP
jgi:hypothetical protein